MDTTNALIHSPSQEQQVMHGFYQVFPAFFLESIDHLTDESFQIYLFRLTLAYRLVKIFVNLLDILVGQCRCGFPGNDFAVVQMDTSSSDRWVVRPEISQGLTGMVMLYTEHHFSRHRRRVKLLIVDMSGSNEMNDMCRIERGERWENSVLALYHDLRCFLLLTRRRDSWVVACMPSGIEAHWSCSSYQTRYKTGSPVSARDRKYGADG